MPWIHTTLSSSAAPARWSRSPAAGRRRDAAVEGRIADAVRRVVATSTGLGVDLVAVVRA